MRILILTDIHGNLPALEAVLAAPEAQGCDLIYSLGDHTGFGPCPRQVHDRLVSLGAVMLMGNHEHRLTRTGDPDLQGYNWQLLHWTKAQMDGADLSFPTDAALPGILLTHGTPGDPYHLVEAQEVPALLDTLPEDVRLLLTGHNHGPWRVEHGGRVALNPGSLGMVEDERGSRAPFAVVTCEGDDIRAEAFEALYDVDDTIRAYLKTGAWKSAPELTRAAVETMRDGRYQHELNLVGHVRQTAQAMGLSLQDEAAWREADKTWHWTENMDSITWWKKEADRL
ncbi:MAG: metallophosphoesterase family protein [Clostridia bacterium]|nr:metallophosphoesterase family protein [Clostridia bacterium]